MNSDSAVAALVEIPALPSVMTDPATAALPAVAMDPATAALAAVAIDPATAALPVVATDRETDPGPVAARAGVRPSRLTSCSHASEGSAATRLHQGTGNQR